jgi:septal ring factor EnvC (AmiA/AmiB activator)
MGTPEVINLLKIANDQLPSVQKRIEELQRENHIINYNLKRATKEFQSLTEQILIMDKGLKKSQQNLKMRSLVCNNSDIK